MGQVRCRVRWIAGAAWFSAVAVHAAPPRAAPNRELTLQVDATALSLGDRPQAMLVSGDGPVRSVPLRDDGQAPDLVAGDGRYAGSASSVPAGLSELRIEGKDGVWNGLAEGLSPDQGRLTWMVELDAEGGLQVTPREPPPPPGPPGGAAPPDGGPPDPPPRVTSPTQLLPGTLLWALAFLGGGLGLGLGIWRYGRGSVRRSQLLDLPHEAIPSRTVEPHALGGLVEGALADHRWVVVGPVPEAMAHVVHYRCADSRPVPEELVAAVEDLAVRDGGPVALLVTDAEQLGRAGRRKPREDLERWVDDRFPLVWLGTD